MSRFLASLRVIYINRRRRWRFRVERNAGSLGCITTAASSDVGSGLTSAGSIKRRWAKMIPSLSGPETDSPNIRRQSMAIFGTLTCSGGQTDRYIRITKFSPLTSARQSRQPSCRFIQRLRLLAKSKPHLPRPIPRIAIETRPRPPSHANLLHQIFCEGNIVIKPERRNIRRHVIRSSRTEALEPRRAESRHQMIPPPPIPFSQFFVVRSGRAQRRRTGLLQWRRRSHRQEIVHFADRVRNRLRRDRPSNAPSRAAVGLRQ